jgi:ATP-dependent DNA helicase PIF1
LAKECTYDNSNISLLSQFHCRENSVASLIDTIYPSLTRPNLSAKYFADRTILCCLNKDIDKTNYKVLQKFSRQSQVFYSIDSIPTSELRENDPLLNYPVEYLNKINCTRFPLARLEVKIGCPIMILQNLDIAYGVCNESRGILTRYRNRVLEIELLTGQYTGQRVFISRITSQPTEEQVAFRFNRRQFPIRVCFAMTINKSQGQSVKHVGLNLTKPAFSHRQFYIGISRVTSVSNIKMI